MYRHTLQLDPKLRCAHAVPTLYPPCIMWSCIHPVSATERECPRACFTQISKRLSAQHRRQLRMGESDLVDPDPAEGDVEVGLSAQRRGMGDSDLMTDILVDPYGSEESLSAQQLRMGSKEAGTGL